MLAVHYEQGDITFERIPQLLVELVIRRQVLAERERERPEDPDPGFAALQKKLEDALAAGDDEQAHELYEQKRDAKLAARKKRLEAAERLREAATRDLLDAAESDAGMGELAHGRLEYRKAAEHFRAAAHLLAEEGDHASARMGYLDSAAETLYKQGHEFGDNGALQEAIRAYGEMLQERPRQRVPLEWAATQNSLGIALTRLGERKLDTALLKEAVEAYQAALEERTPKRVPLQWATTRTNLGIALALLGERESGTGRLRARILIA